MSPLFKCHPDSLCIGFWAAKCMDTIHFSCEEKKSAVERKTCLLCVWNMTAPVFLGIHPTFYIGLLFLPTKSPWTCDKWRYLASKIGHGDHESNFIALPSIIFLSKPDELANWANYSFPWNYLQILKQNKY